MIAGTRVQLRDGRTGTITETMGSRRYKVNVDDGGLIVVGKYGIAATPESTEGINAVEGIPRVPQGVKRAPADSQRVLFDRY